MIFLASLLVTGIGVAACVYVAAALAMLCRREWKDGLSALALCLIPFGIYTVAWRFLPLENWLIFPGALAGIFSTITFALAWKNGV